MQSRKASIKETGEELSQAEWERFDAAVAAAKRERRARGWATPGTMRPDVRGEGAADREERAPTRP